MAQYYLAIGDLEEAMEWIERDAARDTVMVSYYRAAILAASGEIDEALATLEYVLEKGFRDFVTLEASPHFASLREEARYQELISRYQE